MPDATPITALPKRRWYQYSLRSLFIVVSLVAIPCGYVDWQAKIVRDRKAMLPKIEEFGGFPYSVQKNAYVLRERGETPTIPWIRERLAVR